MKTQLLNGILAVVSSVSEISAGEILSHIKRNDVVDARCLFVHFAMRKYGFQTATLATFLNRKRICSVNDCIRNHDLFLMQSVSYRLMCNEIDRKLSTIYPTT